MGSSQILILGGRGMVGSAIATAAGPRTTLAMRPPVLDGALVYDALTDDLSQLLKKLKSLPKAVVIAFGISGVHTCASNPAASRQLNVDCVVATARAAANYGVLPVTFSTDSVFDGTEKAWSETDRPMPINEYGRQKFAAEEAVAKLGVPYLTLRLSRVIADQAHHRDLLYQWVSLIRKNIPIRLPTDQKFTPIAATDLGRIAVQLIDADARGLINVAGPQQVSSQELIDMFRAELQSAGLKDDFPVDLCRVADLPGKDVRLASTMLSIERLNKVISPTFRPLSETVHDIAMTEFTNQASMPI